MLVSCNCILSALSQHDPSNFMKIYSHFYPLYYRPSSMYRASSFCHCSCIMGLQQRLCCLDGRFWWCWKHLSYRILCRRHRQMGIVSSCGHSGFSFFWCTQFHKKQLILFIFELKAWCGWGLGSFLRIESAF